MSIIAQIGMVSAAIVTLLGVIWAALAGAKRAGAKEEALAAKEAAAEKSQEMKNAGDTVDRTRAGVIDRLRSGGL